MTELNDNSFKILLSTDNHLGYLEKDPIRGNDSFITFEEILSISNDVKPDFMLLGGDLFHENKPSVSSLFKCTELLRKYIFNENPIYFQIISDQSVNFAHSQHFQFANFNDKNFNVGMPIFTIHGNHDDPIDQTNLCALDLLHASGLVNLFGKSSSVESIEIQPILMRKGQTKIALYGLGAIRNERLHRLFQQKKVQFIRPAENPDEWFSIFVLHQNRVRHGATNYIPETFIPDFFDLIIWGHEHDCRIDPEYNTSQQFYVSQPGSSVATSLCEGEASTKYIGFLEVTGKDFKIVKTKLNTIRPFVIGSIVLEEEDSLSLTDPKLAQNVERLCHDRLRQMLINSEQLVTNHSQQPRLPLVRLSVDYSGGFEMFSVTRFGQQYVTNVANPKDVIVLHRRREQTARDTTSYRPVSLDARNVTTDDSGRLDHERMEDLVHQHFTKLGDKMRLINEKELGVAVKLTLDKDNKDILGSVVDMQLDRVESHLKKRKTREEAIVSEIDRFSQAVESIKDDDDVEDYIRAQLNETQKRSVAVSGSTDDIDMTFNVKTEQTLPARGRGGRRGGRGRGRRAEAVDDSMDLDSPDVELVSDTNRKRKMKSTETKQSKKK